MHMMHGCPVYFALAQKTGLSYIGVVAALQRGRSASLLPEAPGLVDHHSPSLPRRSTEIWARCRACSAGPFFFLRLLLLPGRWSGGFPTRTRAAIPHAQVGPVAQWLELAAHNGLVAGSSPAGPTSFFAHGRSPPRGRGIGRGARSVLRTRFGFGCDFGFRSRARPSAGARHWPRRPVGLANPFGFGCDFGFRSRAKPSAGARHWPRRPVGLANPVRVRVVRRAGFCHDWRSAFRSGD